MKVVVCVKQVLDEINPFDACALECALCIPEAEITIVSMGKPQSDCMLRVLARQGVSRVVLLTDPAFAGADTLATSYVLALAIGRLEPDLVLCGRQSIDGDTAQVGPCLSQMLGFSLITNVMKIHSIGDRISCTSRMGEETVKIPALLTVEKMNKLRFPSIRAKAKEIEIWTAKDLNADLDRCGLSGSPTRVLRTYQSNIGKKKCTFIQPSELLEIIQTSLSKKNTGIEYEDSLKKLDEIWVVGKELAEFGSSIAEKVKVLDRGQASEIAASAAKYLPKAILWNSDLWSRRNAPIVAAILQTGLCADCTHLETDGEKLYMYRPTYGGSLMAKIECRTLPQMATVRTVTESKNEIIVAGGKGIGNNFELLQSFAEKIGAGLGASRGLVDLGLAPYDLQIGLTGKNVNPRVYIACGISGAVQHTCGIEQAGTVIAINTDKNARIFECADFGIVCDIKELMVQLTI